MKMKKRDCPDCRTRLQPFWVPARRLGDEVELDRCSDCGGVWFDAGELSDASGKAVTASKVRTDRSCPACGAWNLPENICRCANRFWLAPGFVLSYASFRVVRSPRG